MRILVAFEHLGPVGGAQRSVLELAEALATRGHEFVVAYGTADSFKPRWEAFGSQLVPVPLSVSVRRPVRTFLATVRSAKLVQHTRPDVVYCNSFSTLPFCLEAARRLRVPVVTSVREPLVGGARRHLYRWLLGRTSATAFVSIRQRAAYEEAGMVGPESNVIQTGVDTGKYRPATVAERRQAREALGLDDEQLAVVYMGRLDPTKGIETLMACVPLLSDPRVIVLVAGAASVWRHDGEAYAAGLRDSAPQGVHFIGRRDDNRALLWAADVVAVPSTWEEPLARVPLEAMACGVPVVASRIGGLPEIFTGQFEELLFRPNDPDDMVGALRRALPDLSSGRRWDQLMRAHVVEHFSIDRASASLESVLLGAAAG